MKKYLGLEEMSNRNCAYVLNLIRQRGELSRKEISDITKLSWGGMTKIVNKLFENGYIVEDKNEQQAGQGRTPSIIRINRDCNFVIGLDVNRMGFSAQVADLTGGVHQEYSADGAYDNKRELLAAIVSFLGKIVEEYSSHHILAVGIAMQGVLDVKKGISVRFPRCAGWENVPICSMLEETFGIPVFMEHDPDCVLYALMLEQMQENTLLMRIDSSVGMAVYMDGKVLKGSGALEIAHHIVVPNGKECRCGQKGCLEAYIAPCLIKREIQPVAVREMVQPLAISMRNMCSLFNAKRIIITGDLVKYRNLFEKDFLRIFSCIGREEIPVIFVEEANRAVCGATQMAILRAIEGLRL